ncbi:MAG: major facilitator superfamily domain-containing protein [Linnemannia gamsii]|nr:MAG: major facilitator superfamily domain-containing protein [Linnemannia gamsii]
MDDSHLHASYSVSNGQFLQKSDSNNESNTEHNGTNSSNNSKNNRRLKNGSSLGRLHTQGLSSLRPSQAAVASAAGLGGGSGGGAGREYLRADGHVVNPDKLRPTNSALTTSICSTIEPSDCGGFNGITRVIYRHYSRVDFVRTEAQLKREEYLIGDIKFNRWIFLPAAFCFQAVCGTLYAWSVFNNLIDTTLYGPTTNTHMAAITFYVALGCFGISSSIMGPWLERHGPRKAGLLGAALFLLGNLITALGVHVKQIALVYVGYGIFGGLGLGISYISPVSALQKWFPDRRGVAAGLAVSGFGAGSIVMAKIPDPLAAAVGLPMTFVVLGLFYFVVMVICALVFRIPPPGYVVNGLDVWAVRVDDYDEDECSETRTHTEAEIKELGLKSISIEHPNLAAANHILNNSSNHGTGAGIGSSNLQSLHPLHPLQQGQFGPRKSLDDAMSPISPISGTATIIPSAAISMTSRRYSTRSGARTGYDPSISISLMDAFYSREFRLMYIMFLGNTMAGVVIISRLANIATDIFGHNKDTASTIVSINGGFNLVGRLVFASLSDRIGRKNSYMIMLGSQAIILASLPMIMETHCNWAFLTCIWILTSCYGGGFGCIPAFLCDMFGPSNIGPLHGVILTSWSLSSVGAGLLFTAIYNYLLDHGYTLHDSYIYSINMYWILAGAAIGLFMTLFVRTGIRDRLLPSVPGEFFHSRVFGRILRFGRFGLRWVSKEQEEVEWAAYVVQRQLEEEQGHGLHSSHGDHKNLDREEKSSR